jgi:hypothetical protein
MGRSTYRESEMTRSSWFTLAYALMLGAAGPLTACVSHPSDGAQTERAQRSALSESNLDQNRSPQADADAAAGAAGATPAASAYSDAQVQAFVAARTEIQRLTPGTTAEAQAQNQQQISQILQRNSLTPDVYNAIETAARTDQALANRISASAVGTNFTDVQLQALVAASAEIDPLNRQIASATAEQRPAIGAQIRAALQRHNLDIETYNGIAARAQTDQALGQRIAQLRAAQQPAQPPAG